MGVRLEYYLIQINVKLIRKNGGGGGERALQFLLLLS